MATTKGSIKIDDNTFEGDQAIALIERAFQLINKDMQGGFDSLACVESGISTLALWFSELKIDYKDSKEVRRQTLLMEELTKLKATITPYLDAVESMLERLTKEDIFKPSAPLSEMEKQRGTPPWPMRDPNSSLN
jgi:hypothetical protein